VKWCYADRMWILSSRWDVGWTDGSRERASSAGRRAARPSTNQQLPPELTHAQAPHLAGSGCFTTNFTLFNINIYTNNNPTNVNNPQHRQLQIPRYYSSAEREHKVHKYGTIAKALHHHRHRIASHRIASHRIASHRIASHIHIHQHMGSQGHARPPIHPPPTTPLTVTQSPFPHPHAYIHARTHART